VFHLHSRVVEENSKLGFLNRRFGVPLIDGATVRYLQYFVGLIYLENATILSIKFVSFMLLMESIILNHVSFLILTSHPLLIICLGLILSVKLLANLSVTSTSCI
jgi:hypothetical protein